MRDVMDSASLTTTQVNLRPVFCSLITLTENWTRYKRRRWGGEKQDEKKHGEGKGISEIRYNWVMKQEKG